MDHCIKAGIDCAQLAPNEDRQAFFVYLLTASCPIGLRGTYWQRNFAAGSADRGAAAPPAWCRQRTSVRCWASASYSVLGGLRPPACPAVRGRVGRGQARCRAPGATTLPGDQTWQPSALTPPPWARVRSAGCPAAREHGAQPGEPRSALQCRLFRRRVANSRGRREHGQGRVTPRRSSRDPCLCGQPRAGCALLWCGLLSGWSCSAACHSQWQSRAEPSLRTSLLPRKAAELLGIQLHDTPTPQLSPDCRHSSQQQQQLSQLLLPRKFSQTRPPSTLEGTEKALA